MKKIGIPALIVLMLAACNSNNSSNGGSNPGMNENDTSQRTHQGDTTPTTNDNAYNTTDTGLSKGTTLDSSAKHTMMNQSGTKQGKQH